MIARITLSGIKFKVERQDDDEGDVYISVDGASSVAISRQEAKVLAGLIDLASTKDPMK